MHEGRRWSVRDRLGNEVYITDERWEHILDHHPEMELCEAALRETIRSGKRRQDSLNPHKYRYLQPFDGLSEGNTHVEAVVLFRFDEGAGGRLSPNNYVATAYQKRIG